ncbi:MAG: HAMP domain-containing histidine kinase [Myxococcales bacterium]|nr:HAMP domain-containing histidine kinase [Myxococcales bacterium]
MTPDDNRSQFILPSVSLPAETRAAALSAEIRTPLAQIELAASQVYREALTPNARAYAELVFEAVAEIDGLVERTLRVLVPPPCALETDLDLAPVLTKLRRRFTPALAACGIEWKWREPDRGVVTGNPEQVRRFCTELLHLALVLSGEGGQFTLGISQKEEAVEVSLFCRCATALNETQIATAQSAVQHSQAAALEAGGVLSGTMDTLSSDLRLVVPGRDAPSSNLQEASCQEF